MRIFAHTIAHFNFQHKWLSKSGFLEANYFSFIDDDKSAIAGICKNDY